MKKLEIELLNSHGIHALSCNFDFKSNRRANAIYAPNGTMKTSFARTFQDLAGGRDSVDHVFPDRETRRVVTDEAGAAIAPEDVVVILSYDEEVGPTEATSTLLVNSELRKEYEGLQIEISAAKDKLASALKTRAKTKLSVEREVSVTFMKDDESFFRALVRIDDEVTREEAPYANVPYDVIFNDKVLALFKDASFRSALAECVMRLNEVLDESPYFDRETFNYFNATSVSKSLADSGFFKVNHSVVLRDGEDQRELTSATELPELIEAEKARISEDAALRKQYQAIEKLLTKNAEARAFYAYIRERVELLPLLENIDGFRELVWKSYIKSDYELYRTAVDCFRAAEERKDQIRLQANEESTQWESVIRIFNDRFFVPFKLTAENRQNIVLGLDKVLELGFEFEDGADTASVDRADLLRVLSTGEKKALYILNVLFEVERRKQLDSTTLFVVDDIADSFDYKNKYAIIQYLKEMSEVASFRLLILTHNFDFFRTLNSRFVSYDHCFLAQKSDEGIALVSAKGIKNPFVKDFKPNFFSDPMKRIASIPFMRNLLEYTRDEEDPDYLKLTSLLHWKPDSGSIQQTELDRVFANLFGGSQDWTEPEAFVISDILAEADKSLDSSTGINFENKIVLSIAIRLAAEQFMINKINDPTVVDDIESNQTQVLLAAFKARFPNETTSLRVLDAVVLMTPEHIHLNSFMYEPILDMADDHLRKLYAEVKALWSTSGRNE